MQRLSRPCTWQLLATSHVDVLEAASGYEMDEDNIYRPGGDARRCMSEMVLSIALGEAKEKTS